MKKILGVLGGMGPQASIRFYDLLIKASMEFHKAKKNSDYPHILLSNLPVPDLIRSKRAQKKTIDMAKKEVHLLEKAGAELLVMSCNTMHLYLPNIHSGDSSHFLSIVDAVLKRVQKRKHRIVGLLGTKTTLHSKMYTGPLESNGIEVLLPNKKDESLIVRIIYAVIAGTFSAKDKESLNKVIEKFQQKGATAVILGCTELPLVLLDQKVPGVEIIDSLKILAEEAMDQVYAPSRNSKKKK